MKRRAIAVSVALLCIGLVSAGSETVGTKPERRVTLLIQKQTPQSNQWEKATVSFRPEEIYAGSREPHNEWDLLYGELNHNGDRDWLRVSYKPAVWPYSYPATSIRKKDSG